MATKAKTTRKSTKPAPKKKVATKVSAKPVKAEKVEVVEKKKVKFEFNKKKLVQGALTVLAFVLAFTLIDLLFQYLNNDYSMAVVNGVRVPKSQFYDRLEKAYGAQASESLVEEELILQEAQKKGITVTEKEISDRVKEIEDQIGGKDALNSALEANNINMDDLNRQIKLEIYAKKVLEPGIEYTEDDVKEFFEQYKDVLYSENDVTYEDKKAEVEQTFLSQKVEEKKQEWLQELKGNSRIQNNVTEQPSYGFLKTTTNIINNIVEEFKKEK